MVVFHPAEQPGVLSEYDRDAERDVWRIFENLEEPWHVFYSVTEEDEDGFDREVDYILLWCNRILYIEVKGGIVYVDSPAAGRTRWRRTKRNGHPIKKPVRPAQLWDAKKAVARTIKKKLGKRPEQLGFVEYEFHVFPHTPESVTQGKKLDRDKVHYIFQEHMSDWPAQLEALVRSRASRYAEPEDIAAVIAGLHELACPPDTKDQPSNKSAPFGGPALSKARYEPTPTRQAAIIHHPPTLFPTQPPRPFDRTWKRVLLPWICGVAGFLLILLIWPWLEPAKTPSPARGPSATKPSTVSAGQPKPQPPSARSAPPPASVPAQKAPSVRTEEDLPPFIPAGAVAEIERIFETARTLNMSLRWSAGSQYGYVTLQADEGNGCRRWRLSRNDEAAVFDFVRRCS